MGGLVTTIIKRSFSDSDTTTITIKNKLFDALFDYYYMNAKLGKLTELLSYKAYFDKSTVEQVHIKFCKETINTPWYK